MSRVINLIVDHCSASKNGVLLARPPKSASMIIDGWHRNRGFARDPKARAAFNPSLSSIGYHYVIDVDGTETTGRSLEEIGTHVAGYNLHSIGICMVGTDSFTLAQWFALRKRTQLLLGLYPSARVVGHRDLSPDLNHDGTIEPREFMKTCPGFDAKVWWLSNSMQPMHGHILDEVA